MKRVFANRQRSVPQEPSGSKLNLMQRKLDLFSASVVDLLGCYVQVQTIVGGSYEFQCTSVTASNDSVTFNFEQDEIVAKDAILTDLRLFNHNRQFVATRCFYLIVRKGDTINLCFTMGFDKELQ